MAQEQKRRFRANWLEVQTSLEPVQLLGFLVLLQPCVHVEGQALGDVSRRGQEAGPAAGMLQFTDLIVARHGQVRGPHSGHQEGPIVWLQGRGGVQFM